MVHDTQVGQVVIVGWIRRSIGRGEIGRGEIGCGGIGRKVTIDLCRVKWVSACVHIALRNAIEPENGWNTDFDEHL